MSICLLYTKRFNHLLFFNHMIVFKCFTNDKTYIIVKNYSESLLVASTIRIFLINVAFSQNTVIWISCANQLIEKLTY